MTTKLQLDSETIKEIIKIASAVLPLFLTLIDKIVSMVQNANNLPDEDKAELLAMIAEMQAKVSELEEL
jgi:hypothetical protein